MKNITLKNQHKKKSQVVWEFINVRQLYLDNQPIKIEHFLAISYMQLNILQENSILLLWEMYK